MLPHLLVQELRANKGFNSAGQAWLLLNIRRMDTCDPYPGYASRLTATGLLSDPWLDGRPRFQRRPLMLSSRDLASLYEAAEGVLAVLHELAVICGAEPQLVQHWFGLTRAQQIMWAASARYGKWRRWPTLPASRWRLMRAKARLAVSPRCM